MSRQRRRRPYRTNHVSTTCYRHRGSRPPPPEVAADRFSGPWSALRAARGAVSSAREERGASWIGGRRARSLRRPGVVFGVSPGVSPGRLVQPRPGRRRFQEIVSFQWLARFPGPCRSPPGRLPRPEWSGIVRDSPASSTIAGAPHPLPTTPPGGGVKTDPQARLPCTGVASPLSNGYVSVMFRDWEKGGERNPVPGRAPGDPSPSRCPGSRIERRIIYLNMHPEAATIGANRTRSSDEDSRQGIP